MFTTKSTPDHNISAAILIEKVTDSKFPYYKLSTQYSDEDKPFGGNFSISSSDMLINLINMTESTTCKRILIVVSGDEELRENLKVLTGQSTAKTKVSVLNKISYNSKEKQKLSSMFRVLNIEVL